MTEDQYIEELPAHHYRTEIPNCLIDAGLDVYQLAVYIYIKRIAGDGGRCFQTEKNIAKALGISERQFRYARNALCSPDNNFKYPLLKKTTRKKPDGSADSNIYTVIDIWGFNLLLYRTQKSSGTAPDAGGVGHSVPEGGALSADKEEPSQEEPIKNACLSAPENPETILFKGMNGKIRSLTRSDIHKHFLKKGLSPEKIELTITEFKTRTTPMSDPFKVLDFIAKDVKAPKAEKKKGSYEAIPIKNPVKFRVEDL